MNIAYLILCHTDPEHISRLAKKIRTNSTWIYIHVDISVDSKPFKELLQNEDRITLIKNRIKPYWGGFSAVEATMDLLKAASNEGRYDRYVLLQGLDYPILANCDIEEFFIDNRNIEFIRGCNITDSKDYYLYSKCKMYWFFDKKNLLRKCLNRLNRILKICNRKGYIMIGNKRFNIFWGAAQWALTSECVEYVIDFYNSQNKVNNYFRHVFPADETYFHTVVFNSTFAMNTTLGGPEKEVASLEYWRNLHYFEYPDKIKIFKEDDYEKLMNRECLFIRKTTTKESSRLLDMIDNKTIDLK